MHLEKVKTMILTLFIATTIYAFRKTIFVSNTHTTRLKVLRQCAIVH